MLRSGFTGVVYPVNVNNDSVMSVKALPFGAERSGDVTLP